MTKQLKDLTIGELHHALIEMLKKLNIAGSTPSYNLYNAVAEEWRKDKEYGKLWKKLNNK